MKVLRYAFFAAFVASGVLHAQESYPFVSDSLTRALWHLKDSSGSVIHDSSMYHNDGTAIGTTVTQGPFGLARSFNGNGDYIVVPSDTSLDFGDASFMIDAWFKTAAEEGIIVRRKGPPVVGYNLMVLGGCVLGEIGADANADPLLQVISTKKYNDDLWHHARFVRDRSALKLFLYVDDSLAAPPIDDIFTKPIVSDRPLTIGRWENLDYPQYFTGSIAEVRLWCSKALRSSVQQINVDRVKVDFGKVRVGTTETLPLKITNSSYTGTLVIDSIVSTLPAVTSSDTAFMLAAGESRTISLSYTPDAAEKDSGQVSIYCNDPQTPSQVVIVEGMGLIFTRSPIIDIVTLDPSNYSQAHLEWFRSTDDSSGATDQVTQYTIWGRFNQSVSSSMSDPQPVQVLSDGTLSEPWQYLATVPAVGFDKYGANVPHPYRSSYLGYWNECVVAAQTVDHKTYLSLPDTLVPSPSVTGIEETKKTEPQGYSLFQNYPNPFNPTTGIRFQASGISEVRLSVYDVLGREVAVLVDGQVAAGIHEVRFDGSRLASGVYFYRLTAGRYVATKAMLLEK